jgi:hypothetical protein
MYIGRLCSIVESPHEFLQSVFPFTMTDKLTSKFLSLLDNMAKKFRFAWFVSLCSEWNQLHDVFLTSDLLCWDRSSCIYNQSLNNVSCGRPYHRKARNPYKSEQILPQTCFPQLTAGLSVVHPLKYHHQLTFHSPSLSRSEYVESYALLFSTLRANKDRFVLGRHTRKSSTCPRAQQPLPPNWHPQVVSSAKRDLPFLKTTCSSLVPIRSVNG